MNKRIEELIRSADVHIISDESEYGHTVVGMEKFAKLIVKECIAQCNDGDSRHFISTHFGIEE